jgi:uncharacterized protein YuzE
LITRPDPDFSALYIEFCARAIAEFKDFDENTILALDAEGSVCAITFEHASHRTDESFDG